MVRMRRPAALVTLVLLAAACGGETVPQTSRSPVLSPSDSTSASASEGPVSSPSATASASPSPSPATIELPSDAPTSYAKPASASDVPLASLVPPGAQVTNAWRPSTAAGGISQIAVAWTRGGDPFAAEHGFEVWQAFPDKPAWRVVYAFTDAAGSGVLGLRFDAGDVTGDGLPDLLSFEDVGGSGACGVWRVVESTPGSAAQILRRKTCDTQMRIVGGTLRIRSAVYRTGDAHCCPSAYRTTTLRWNQTAWTVIARETTPA